MSEDHGPREDVSLRKRLSLALDPEMRRQSGLSTPNQVAVCCIVLSILLGVAETEPLLTLGHEGIYRVARILFFCIFAVEYAARLYAAPENPRYRTSLRYALSSAAVSDLIVLVSFVLPFFGMEATLLRMFRAARLVRLARLGRYSLAMRSIFDAVISRRHELGLSILLALGLMLLSSTALYMCEGTGQPEAFGSIPRALWWSVATLTTVGYGDVVPVTVPGRLFAAVTALTGIGIIAIPTGILAGAFSEGLSRTRKGKDGPPG